MHNDGLLHTDPLMQPSRRDCSSQYICGERCCGGESRMAGQAESKIRNEFSLLENCSVHASPS